MKQLTLILFLIAFSYEINAQVTASKDSLHVVDSLTKAKEKAFEDSVDNALIARSIYPVIKSGKYSGIIPVEGIDEKPNPNQRYKILMEVTKGIKDSAAAKEINGTLVEVGRQINLHVAASIPQKNLDIVVIAHGPILKALYNNATYKEKYKINNPNDTLLNELRAAGVKFIVCGQAMNFFSVEKAQLFPWIKVALSAQTVITDYQLRGYILRYL